MGGRGERGEERKGEERSDTFSYLQLLHITGEHAREPIFLGGGGRETLPAKSGASFTFATHFLSLLFSFLSIRFP